MELKENFVNDPTEVVTVDSTAPAVVVTATDEGAKSLALNASDLSKKLVEKEMRQPFPVKVYEMLENAESKQFSHIVSWNTDGTGFMVHDKEYFTKEIVPHYFNLTKYKSFQRQVGRTLIFMTFVSLLFFQDSRSQCSYSLVCNIFEL